MPGEQGQGEKGTAQRQASERLGKCQSTQCVLGTGRIRCGWIAAEVSKARPHQCSRSPKS